MQYISAEEFLKADEKVQNQFLDWWQPSVGDIYCNLYNGQENNVLVINQCQFGFKSFKDDIKQYGIPLLTEGQLRAFITSKGIYIDIVVLEPSIYQINQYSTNSDGYCELIEVGESFVDTDLLQTLWKVACMIAKEEFHDR